MMMLLRELINIHILPTGYETLFTLAVSAPRQLRSTLPIMILKPGTLGLGNQGIPERAAGPHLCSSGYRTNDTKKTKTNAVSWGGRLAPAQRIIDMRHIVCFVCRMVDSILPALRRGGALCSATQITDWRHNALPTRRRSSYRLTLPRSTLPRRQSCTTCGEWCSRGLSTLSPRRELSVSLI